MKKVYSALKTLIDGGSSVILSLPLLKPDEKISDLDIPQEHKWLIGFWVHGATYSPCNRLSKWGRQELHKNPAGFWSPKCRERLARTADLISHWKIIHGDYKDAPDIEATWFIDPPYQVMGKHYPDSDIDYQHLSNWCLNRRGQVIVCEGEGADWLPFKHLYEHSGSQRYRNKKSPEFIFEKNTNDV